jgi:nicotinamide riboside kinase
MTKVINLFSGPGTGKSTIASAIFSEVKIRGLNCELVHEYIKKWVYEGRSPKTFDQLYILGQQSKAESLLYNKVEYLITDSPLLIIPFYEKMLVGKEIVKPAVKNFIEHAESQGVIYYNFWLNRPSNYDEKGRYQTKAESEIIDQSMKNFLKEEGINLIELSTNHDERLRVILETLDILKLQKLS